MGFKKISIRDGKFRKVVDGKEVEVGSDVLDVVIVNAARMSRMFYSGTYDPNRAATPSCWSSNTQAPDPDVAAETKQSSRCIDCEQNIRGSGGGGSRACKFLQRIAVTFVEDNLYDVFQLQLPATSLFGEAERGWMSMQNYVKHLVKHDTAATNVVTRICFEQTSYAPRLRFRPMRVLDEAELKIAMELEKHPDTLKAITFSAPPVWSSAASPFDEVEGFTVSQIA